MTNGPMTTAVPADLTDLTAALALVTAGLTLTAEAGAWDALPTEAKNLFAAALFSPIGGPAEAVADLARERDDERALSNKLLAKLTERDATIRALRAEIAASKRLAA